MVNPFTRPPYPEAKLAYFQTIQSLYIVKFCLNSFWENNILQISSHGCSCNPLRLENGFHFGCGIGILVKKNMLV